MTGKPGRSGRPKAEKKTPSGDGSPESPRTLSKRAKHFYSWLIERLDASAAGSPWRRVDGVAVAALAELLEDQEAVATAIANDPTNVALLRLRIQHSDRVYKFSGIVGLVPRDRERLPQPVEPEQDAFAEWLNS